MTDEPKRIAELPRNKGGYRIPWFVATIDGEPDFRVIEHGRIEAALKGKKCWICGRKMSGPTAAFVIGPMCAVNRVSAEPPSHQECAVYAATTCPFLINPKKRRREGNKPKDAAAPAGEAILRNPGVGLVWVTRHWSTFPDGKRGILFDVGEPLRCLWFAEGRPASSDEILHSIATGLPRLADLAAAEGPEAVDQLARQTERALRLIPRTTEGTELGAISGPDLVRAALKWDNPMDTAAVSTRTTSPR